MKVRHRLKRSANGKLTLAFPKAVLALLFVGALTIFFVSCTRGRGARFPHRGSVEKYSTHEVVSGQILIKFREPARWRNEQDQETKINGIAGQSVAFETIGTSDLILVECPDKESIPALIERFNRDPDVEFAEPDFVVPLNSCAGCSMPGDPLLRDQWGAAKIDACDAWNLETERDKVVVAVIDSGIGIINGSLHEDLKNNIWLPPTTLTVELNGNIASPPPGAFGFDATFLDSDPNDKKWQPEDNSGHGTSVAGIIAAGNDDHGIRGISDGSKVLVVKYTSGGNGCISSIARAIDFIIQAAAQDNRIRIVNCSFGLFGADLSKFGKAAALKTAFDRLASANLLVVAANADEAKRSPDHPQYPSSYGYSNLIAVTATNCDDGLYSFAAFDKDQDNLIGAPGESIMAPVLSGRLYRPRVGTSFAAAFVSGAAALVLSDTKDGCNELKAPQLQALLLKTADTIPGLQDYIQGGRRLNVYNAMKYCRQ